MIEERPQDFPATKAVMGEEDWREVVAYGEDWEHHGWVPLSMRKLTLEEQAERHVKAAE